MVVARDHNLARALAIATDRVGRTCAVWQKSGSASGSPVLRGTWVLGPQYPTDIPPRSYFIVYFCALYLQLRISPIRTELGGGPDTLEGLSQLTQLRRGGRRCTTTHKLYNTARGGNPRSDTRREGTCVRPAPARIAPLLSLDYGSLMPSNGAVPSPAAAHIRWPRCALSQKAARRLLGRHGDGARAAATRRGGGGEEEGRGGEEECGQRRAGRPSAVRRRGWPQLGGECLRRGARWRLAGAWRGSRQCKRGVSGHDSGAGWGGCGWPGSLAALPSARWGRRACLSPSVAKSAQTQECQYGSVPWSGQPGSCPRAASAAGALQQAPSAPQ